MKRLMHDSYNFPPNISNDAKNLFFNLTCKNPLERWTADKALRDPWITRKDEQQLVDMMDYNQFFEQQNLII